MEPEKRRKDETQFTHSGLVAPPRQTGRPPKHRPNFRPRSEEQAKKIQEFAASLGMSVNELWGDLIPLVLQGVNLDGLQAAISPDRYLSELWYIAQTASHERVRVQALALAARIQGYLNDSTNVVTNVEIQGLSDPKPAQGVEAPRALPAELESLGEET